MRTKVKKSNISEIRQNKSKQSKKWVKANTERSIRKVNIKKTKTSIQ